MSACTSNSSFPSPSISAALTPQESDLTEIKPKSDFEEPKPPADLTKDQAPDEPTAKPEETQLALASSTSEPPSVEAVASAVKPEGATPTPKPSPKTEAAKTTDDAITEAHSVSGQAEQASAAEDQQESAPSPERKGFFASLFQPSTRKPKRDVDETRVAKVRKPAPRVRLTARKRATETSSGRRSGGIVGLPGVKRRNIFDIDEEGHEEFEEPIRTASIANLATRGRHGLLLQRPGVKVGCFTRPLLSILRKVERRFRRKPIVTSGYRSPRHNRMVRGARRSTHIRCMAADIQVKGVSKWKLAKYLRTLPGRGGVGTYCHTKSVHIDIGKKRAWHYCKRSRKKRRRKA